MALSMNDFKTATAYPCGKNKQACRSMLKEIPELENVKMYSVRETLSKGSKSSLKTKDRVSTR